ncbi:MAG: DUF948 domain-containing protein [Actinobacteria bacterium]|nr:DUF948 domain-containing protein [Actinomycetota bacterium]
MNLIPIVNGSIVLMILFIIAVLVQVVRLLNSVNNFVKDTHKEVVPSLNKLQTTIDEINSELARVDTIVQSVQDVTEKVSTTTKVAQEALSSPLIKLAGFSTGIKKTLDSLMKLKNR